MLNRGEGCAHRQRQFPAAAHGMTSTRDGVRVGVTSRHSPALIHSCDGPRLAGFSREKRSAAVAATACRSAWCGHGDGAAHPWRPLSAFPGILVKASKSVCWRV